MLTVFANIQDVKRGFFEQVRESGYDYMTELDFRNWLFEAINFLGLLYTDFQFSGHSNIEFSEPVTRYDVVGDLYTQLKELFHYPELEHREVSKCMGFLKDDILYFHLEFMDE